ncbi:MAG: siphovirus Gp157 family protein [Elusimicrobiaceae bacterium]|nr:siphovirus Gp157 family protein [Elusimicrobiaceae bacterium]
MNLYELTGDMLKLQQLLENGEVVDTELLNDVLADTTADYEEKIENCAKVYKNLTSDVEGIDAEIKRLTARKKALKTNADNLKARMYDSMKATNTPKVKGKLFTIAIQANGGKLPVIVDVSTDKLPDDLVRIEEKPDLDAIAVYITEHPACGYAHFGERDESLRIK